MAKRNNNLSFLPEKGCVNFHAVYGFGIKYQKATGMIEL